MRVRHIQNQTHKWLVETQANLDKAMSLDDSFYYNGMTDAYSDVLHYAENGPVNALAAKFPAKLLAIVPLAIVVHHIVNEYRKAQDA